MKIRREILIVDDIEFNRKVFRHLLCEKYDVIEAENGIEAIKIIIERYKESLAVVLLDIIMPEMDGFEVLEEMKRCDWLKHLPVVLLTEETASNFMQKGYDMGAIDVINKQSFAPTVIQKRIDTIIEQYTYKLHLESLVEQQSKALRIQSKRLRKNSAQIIDILSAVIEFKNMESVDHITNIRSLTRLLMKKLSLEHSEYGFSDELIETISESAAMHDIGKVAISDNILNKPGRLTVEEFEIMKTHSIKGCEILEKLSSLQYLDYYDYCYEICRHHHERWDGKGYPDGLLGDQTPIWAQVVSLADVYDALISKRVYKSAYSNDEAIRMIIGGECGMFNPILIDCFLSLMPSLKEGIKDNGKQN